MRNGGEASGGGGDEAGRGSQGSRGRKWAGASNAGMQEDSTRTLTAVFTPYVLHGRQHSGNIINPLAGQSCQSTALMSSGPHHRRTSAGMAVVRTTGHKGHSLTKLLPPLSPSHNHSSQDVLT
eukprot:358714-Chlamydomonas_euryale.AAC.2